MAAVFVFVLALVLLGYAISSFARTQMQAMQLTFFFFLPSLLLSGFMFPYRGMPRLGAGPRRALPAHPFHPRHPRRDAEGRRPADDLRARCCCSTLFVAAYAAVALARYRRTLD